MGYISCFDLISIRKECSTTYPIGIINKYVDYVLQEVLKLIGFSCMLLCFNFSKEHFDSFIGILHSITYIDNI